MALVALDKGDFGNLVHFQRYASRKKMLMHGLMDEFAGFFVVWVLVEENIFITQTRTEPKVVNVPSFLFSHLKVVVVVVKFNKKNSPKARHCAV